MVMDVPCMYWWIEIQVCGVRIEAIFHWRGAQGPHSFS